MQAWGLADNQLQDNQLQVVEQLQVHRVPKALDTLTGLSSMIGLSSMTGLNNGRIRFTYRPLLEDG
jgi:hypothetical protein